MRIADEPSTTEVRGLVLHVDYEKNVDQVETARWSATLEHPNLGKLTSHGRTPSDARNAARERLTEQLDSLMVGHAQKHAHEVA